MSKFTFSVLALLILLGFMQYPTMSDNNNSQQQTKEYQTTVFPLSEQIKLARFEKKITQQELAQKVGITPLTLERIEHGKEWPTDEILKRMETSLNTHFIISE